MEGMDSSVREDQLIMADELYIAAMRNDVNIFYYNSSRGDEYFLGKTWASNNNILHIASRHGSWIFAREARKIFPHLTRERNSDGNTPLHFAIEFKGGKEGELFLEEALNEPTDTKPWRIQNSMGNTLLHLALIHNHLFLARFLVNEDSCLAEIVNASMEAPLHLAIKHFPHDVDDPDADIGWLQHSFIRLMEQKQGGGFIQVCASSSQDYMGELIVMLVEQATCVARWRDASGLSPLHRAVLLPTIYNLAVVQCIVKFCPQSIEECDSTGKTILHHLVNRIQNVTEGKDLLRITRIDGLINYQDEEGNTAAHLAVINNDINMLHVLEYFPKFNWRLKNKEGLSTTTLLERHNLKQMLKRGSITKLMSSAAENADAYMLLDAEDIFDQTLRAKDSDGRSIFHK